MAETTYDLMVRSPADDSLLPIGTATVASDGRLALVSAATGAEDSLGRVFEAVNALALVPVKVPPPPGAEPYSIHLDEIARDAPGIAEAVRAHLEQSHGLVLAEPEPEPDIGDLLNGLDAD